MLLSSEFPGFGIDKIKKKNHTWLGDFNRKNKEEKLKRENTRENPLPFYQVSISTHIKGNSNHNKTLKRLRGEMFSVHTIQRTMPAPSSRL